ncbi:hypothetical protein EX30DRAFT_334611 [Ascodesmis nigricans]|uniref:Stress-response A/B barrel domain-containing protein n=1 Tax=Ascodesmis nigricans TaxID=341454 RepID=A0A4S2MMI5_9PEZI|nr:hypothetical protein EX30DRAFT_334611 [Ascodesmis nigricans]
MPITHLVTFRLPPPTPAPSSLDSPSPTPAELLCSDFAALQHRCVRPDGTPYILNIRGGRNCSIEGLEQRGYTHTFVVEFASTEDRDYYVNEDPAHREFVGELVRAVVGGVDGVLVVDFEEGVY